MTAGAFPQARLERRRFLGLAAGAAGAAVLPGRAGASEAVELRPMPGRQQLGPAARTGEAEVWGYGGRVPGPEIRLRQGERLRAVLENGLAQPTTVHWHGIRIDNAMDGVAHLTQHPVAPGERFVYDFAVPDAGTYWYHPHNRSWEQMARGLYGALVVEEAAPPAVDRDLVLMLDDWRLTEAGAIDEDSFGSGHDWSHAGRLGNWPTVNGAPQPEIPVGRNERLRLRLANAANATVLVLRLDGMRGWTVAHDGQPSGPAALDGEVTLAPGQRVDVIADVTGGAATLMIAGRENFTAARFPVGAPVRPAPVAEPPAPLAPNPLAEPDAAAARRVELRMTGGAMRWLAEARVGERHAAHGGGTASGVLDGRTLAASGLFWAFNGVAGMPGAPFFEARRGETLEIAMVNETGWPHAMHFHGHHVREAATGLWRDTVLLGRGETARVLMVADNPGDWMLHCHMLEHQAGGMATWFRVA